MSKATIIMTMFLGLLLFYILYIVNKTAKDVNKLESFQNSVVVTKVIEEDKAPGTIKSIEKEKVIKSDAVDDDKEERIVKTEVLKTEVIKDDIETPIRDDKERYYFIGKHLFELHPENGASVFFDEVDDLTSRYKGLTPTEIKKKLAMHIKDSGKNEQVTIDKSTRDEIYGIAGRMVEVTDKLKQQTQPSLVKRQFVESFVQPSSYETQYMAYESLKKLDKSKV
jgi:hypothetical protein